MVPTEMELLLWPNVIQPVIFMFPDLTPSEKAWLSAFFPAFLIAVLIAIFTLTRTGELSSSTNLNLLFWFMTTLAVASLFGFITCKTWALMKKRQHELRKRRRRKRRSTKAHQPPLREAQNT